MPQRILMLLVPFRWQLVVRYPLLFPERDANALPTQAIH